MTLRHDTTLDTMAGPHPWRATLAGAAAVFVGIGLARFAYTPLIPAVIDAGWFEPAAAVYLGAANLAGYLIGALLASRLASRWPAVNVLRAMMLVASVAMLACATPVSFVWFFAWRLAAGIAGGALMVLAAPTVLPLVPMARRGFAGGVIFTGVGLGIAASGSLVPLLLTQGIEAAWIGLGVLCLALTALAWTQWPSSTPSIAPATPAALSRGTTSRARRALRGVYVTYGLNAVGLVPHMVFLVDFVARGLDRGIAAGALCWIAFGIGAILGPTAAGAVADRIGFVRALRLAFIIQAAATGLILIDQSWPALLASSAIVGAFVPGVVPLVLGRVRALAPPEPKQQRAAWSLGTAAFALGQAAAAYALSWVFAQTGDYTLLFAAGVVAFVVALVIDLLVGRDTERE
ncbi:MAG: YbfB/YjiJ family MFS transporter [Alphaproteobacteria bacterium]|nr:YbfB/YjiJ family MFS transporter [Alphaproteobacteria bacterium]